VKFHRRWLAASLPLLWTAQPAMALEWELSTTTAKPAGLQWQMLPETTSNTADLAIKSNQSEINSSDSTSAGNYTFNETAYDENTVKTNTLEIIPATSKPYAPTQLVWEPVAEADVITPEQVAAEIPEPVDLAKALANAILINRSGPTYANYRALWRDGDWLPQISNTVPVGFGPQGFMASLNYRFIDCTTGAGRCSVPNSYQEWINNANTQGDAYLNATIGFGDSLKMFGVIISNTTQGTAYSGPRSKDGFLGGNMTGLHIAKAFGPDTSIRIGVENLIRWDWPQADLEKNAYGVISQRIRLQSSDRTWFKNLYLTAGIGNGAFRPLDEQVLAQIAAQRAAGCSTYGYQPRIDCTYEKRRWAVQQANEFGSINPIGALGIEVFNGFNLITEWSGRNLNAGISIRPFPELGLIVTPMLENLLPNCDYGCHMSVPGYAQGVPIPVNGLTNRPRFSLQASIEFKF